MRHLTIFKDLNALARLLITVVIVIPIVWLLAYGFSRDPRYIQSPLIARQAPSFTLPLFGGGTIRLEDLRGKVVFLNFWASWCPPCRAEARTLEAAWQRYKDRGIVFLGIDIQDTDQDARACIKEFGITYLNAWDASGKVAIEYGVWGIPETYFIDRKGRITYKQVGALGWPIITAKLDEALRGIVSAQEGRGDYRPIR